MAKMLLLSDEQFEKLKGLYLDNTALFAGDVGDNALREQFAEDGFVPGYLAHHVFMALEHGALWPDAQILARNACSLADRDDGLYHLDTGDCYSDFRHEIANSALQKTFAWNVARC
jgi:hypothetical protein